MTSTCHCNPAPSQYDQHLSLQPRTFPICQPPQVLSAPDVLLSRLSSFLSASRQLSPRLAALPPLLVLDPAAGEGNYTQHLPDGMGRMPTVQLVGQYGWHAVSLPTRTRTQIEPKSGKYQANMASAKPIWQVPSMASGRYACV